MLFGFLTFTAGLVLIYMGITGATFHELAQGFMSGSLIVHHNKGVQPFGSPGANQIAPGPGFGHPAGPPSKNAL